MYAPAGLATPPVAEAIALAVADEGDDSGVDDSQCVTQGRADARLANRLVGPLAEDDYSEPTEPEVPESAVAAPQALPNRSLTPEVRAPNTAAGAAAAADAQARVHLGLIRWCVIQRSANPDTTGGYHWEAYDAVVDHYRAAGVPIRSLKVVDAPKWAARPTCVDNAARSWSDIKWCPPRPERETELRNFAKAAALHYGPGGYGISRISFWNEPNLAENWGRERYTSPAQRQADAQEYSDLLQAFYVAAKAVNPDIKIDAGEIAAGGSEAMGDGVRSWAKHFAVYNQSRTNFDELTIHAYSEYPVQIPRKVANYLALPGVPRVGVSEFGWAVRSAGTPNSWRCVNSETGEGSQKATFNNVVTRVWESTTTVRRLVWFNLVDNPKEGPPCRDEAWYNLPPPSGGEIAGKSTNTFGLFKRRRDGTLPSFADATARPLRAAFVCTQAPPAMC